MVFQILPNKLNYVAGEQVTIQVTADPNVTWDVEVIKDGGAVLLLETGTGSKAFNISLIVAQNGAGDYQIVGATRYVSGYDSVVIHVTGMGLSDPAWFDWEVRIGLYKLPGFSDLSESVLGRVVDAINLVVEPLGYRFVSRTISWEFTPSRKGLLSVYYKETGTYPIAIPPIVAATILILASVSLLIIAVGVYKWVGASATVTTTQAGVYENAAAILKQKSEAGEITYEEYIKALQELQGILPKPTDWTTLVIIAGAAIIAAALLPKLVGGKK